MRSATGALVPTPVSISEAARAYLERPAIDPPSYPALDDRTGWLAMIEQRDRSICMVAR